MKLVLLAFLLGASLGAFAQLPPSVLTAPKQPPTQVPATVPAAAPAAAPATISFAAVRTDYATYAGKGPVWVLGYVNVADSPARFGPQTHFGFEIRDKSGRWSGVFDGAKASARMTALRAKILEKGKGRCALLIRLDRDPFLHRDEMSGELLDWAIVPAEAKAPAQK